MCIRDSAKSKGTREIPNLRGNPFSLKFYVCLTGISSAVVVLRPIIDRYFYPILRENSHTAVPYGAMASPQEGVIVDLGDAAVHGSIRLSAEPHAAYARDLPLNARYSIG